MAARDVRVALIGTFAAPRRSPSSPCRCSAKTRSRPRSSSASGALPSARLPHQHPDLDVPGSTRGPGNRCRHLRLGSTGGAGRRCAASAGSSSITLGVGQHHADGRRLPPRPTRRSSPLFGRGPVPCPLPVLAEQPAELIPQIDFGLIATAMVATGRGEIRALLLSSVPRCGAVLLGETAPIIGKPV